MMNSLEIRNPFLDSRLIRFVSKLKFQYLVSKISRKILLKEYAKSFIPKEILNQKQKYRMPSNLVILVYEILFKK